MIAVIVARRRKHHRESSKESSEESDETGISGLRLGAGSRGAHRNKLVKQQSRHSEMSASSGVSGVSEYSGIMMTSPSLSLTPEDKR